MHFVIWRTWFTSFCMFSFNLIYFILFIFCWKFEFIWITVLSFVWWWSAFRFLSTCYFINLYRHCNWDKMRIVHMEFSMDRDVKCACHLILCIKWWNGYQIPVYSKYHLHFLFYVFASFDFLSLELGRHPSTLVRASSYAKSERNSIPPLPLPFFFTHPHCHTGWTWGHNKGILSSCSNLG